MEEAPKSPLSTPEPTVYTSFIQPQPAAKPFISAYHAPFRPLARRLTSWFIFAAFLVLILCIVAIGLIIQFADGAPVNSWAVTPSVCLAIVANVSIGCLAFLLTNGVAMIWWQATSRGTTIRTLYDIWGLNNGLLFRPNRWHVGMAKSWDTLRVLLGVIIITPVSFAINPMLQEAIKSTRTDTTSEPARFKLDILDSIPEGLVGSNLGGPSTSRDFGYVTQQWYNRAKMTTPHRCQGRCEGVIAAPGLSVTCTSANSTEVVRPKGGLLEDQYIFNTNLTLMVDDNGVPYGDVVVKAVVSMDDDCTGHFVETNCRVYASRRNYTVVVEDDAVSIAEPATAEEWAEGEILSFPGDMPDAELHSMQGPLRALHYPFEGFLEGYAFIGKDDMLLHQAGILTETSFSYLQPPESKCRLELQWSNPIETILLAIREMVFRLALLGSKASGGSEQDGGIGSVTSIPPTREFDVVRSEEKRVYDPNHVWFGVAIACLGLGLIAATLLVWGMWDVWRDVSMNPLETAQVLHPGVWSGDMDADGVVDSYGHVPVKRENLA